MNLNVLASAALLAALAAGCAAGASSNDGASASSADLTTGKTDLAIQTELDAAAKGLTYTSESDYPWTYVTAKSTPAPASGALTVDDVRALFGSYVDDDPDADKPIAKLVSETRSFAEWTSGDFTDCDTTSTNDPVDAAACLRTQKMDTLLEANLGDLKVYLFGASGADGLVDGTAVSVFIVGRTPEGNWAGVRTIAIWT